MLEALKDTEAFESEEESGIFTEYGFDFEKNELTGEKVSGAEAVKIWAYFALKIQRYRFRMFTFDYGSESETLIGKSYGRDYTESEIKRLITECLTVNPYITGVSDFTVNFESSRLTVSFKLETAYGGAEMSENFEI